MPIPIVTNRVTCHRVKVNELDDAFVSVETETKERRKVWNRFIG